MRVSGWGVGVVTPPLVLSDVPHDCFVNFPRGGPLRFCALGWIVPKLEAPTWGKFWRGGAHGQRGRVSHGAGGKAVLRSIPSETNIRNKNARSSLLG